MSKSASTMPMETRFMADDQLQVPLVAKTFTFNYLERVWSLKYICMNSTNDRAEPDYVYGPFSASNDLSSSPSSDVKLDIMKGWIDTCVQSHDRCRPPANQCVPRRLIHLIDDEQRSIRLHSPATPVQFAALSYRWGPDEQFKTLKENLSARYKILDTSPWPKSLQDSLIIARGLGLQYIWIDAICIVQDDTDDWAEEASNMARIYSTAHVVLSATSAKDSAEGFLKERSAPFLIESQRRDGSIQEYYARRNNSHTCDLVSKRTDYPLFERGWCLQERLLARRLIHFLPDEIRYECQVGRECECGVASREYGFEAARQGSYSFPELRSAKSMEGLEFAWLWMSMIWDYSRMHLSEPTDNLPAFSGLAACMEHLNPGKYIAGMWEHNIAIQLGWRHDEKDDSAHELQPPKLALHGPTFSWSSYTKPLAIGAPYDTQSLILCRLDHADIRLATVNPYGQIHEASIRLSGHCVPGDEMIRHLQTTIPKDSERLVQLDTGFYFCADNPISDESLENAMEWRSVMCFGLYEFEDKETTTHTVDVLLLQLKGVDSSEHIRIGVAQNLEPAWFHEHATERTVTIV
jgi:hypothetical protein